MKIYHYDVNRVYLESGIAAESPLEPGIFLIPAHATPLKPPKTGQNEAAVFDPEANKWSISPDFRGTDYWDADGEKHTITEVGERVPDGASLTEPPPPPPTPDELEARFTREVDARLNAFAREHEWDTIGAAILQSGSALFHEDSIVAQAAYDATWEAVFPLIDPVRTGAISVEDAIAKLPSLVWP